LSCQKFLRCPYFIGFFLTSRRRPRARSSVVSDAWMRRRFKAARKRLSSFQLGFAFDRAGTPRGHSSRTTSSILSRSWRRERFAPGRRGARFAESSARRRPARSARSCSTSFLGSVGLGGSLAMGSIPWLSEGPAGRSRVQPVRFVRRATSSPSRASYPRRFQASAPPTWRARPAADRGRRRGCRCRRRRSDRRSGPGKLRRCGARR